MKERLIAAWTAFKYPEITEEKDSLTGLLVRRTFIPLAEQELKRAQRGQPLSVVFVDLDKLKEVNDQFGHAEGDKYLVNFAQAARDNIRSYDILVRWGADEFVLMLPGASYSVAENIIKRIQSDFPNFSWGIVQWCEKDNGDLQGIIKSADILMYEQKEKKKGGKK